MSLVTETSFALGSYEKFQPGFRDELKAFSSPEPVVSWSRGRLQIKPSGSGDENELKANDPGDEFWHEGAKKADMRNTKIISFAPIIAFATLKAESLQLIAMLMMRKMQQANTRRCHLGQNSSCFHPGNRADESYGKIPSPLRPVSNVVLLPCRTQLIELNSTLARQ